MLLSDRTHAILLCACALCGALLVPAVCLAQSVTPADPSPVTPAETPVTTPTTGDIPTPKTPEVEVEIDADVEQTLPTDEGGGADVETQRAQQTGSEGAPLDASAKTREVEIAEGGRTVELEALRDLASKRAAVMRVSEAKIRHAEWQRFRAEYGWAPKLQADSTLAPVPANTDPNNLSGNFDEIAAFNIGPFFRQTVNVVIPVYTFGRLDAAEDLAQIGWENAALEARDALLDLDYQVKRAYYGLQLARTFGALLEDGDRLVSEKLEEMEEARDFGEADFKIQDFRKLEIFSADLAARGLDNHKIVVLGIAGLAYLTGETIALENIPPIDEGADSEPLESLAHYQSVAQGKRPQIAQLERAVQARRGQLDLQVAEFFPNVFVGANVTYGVSNQEIARQTVDRLEGGQWVETDLGARPFSNPYDQFSVGILLGARWNFDYFQLYGSYKETEALLDQTLAQQEQALGAIRLEIMQLYAEADQARERIAIQARRLQAARRWRDQIGLSAQTAGADVSDALDPLKAYYEARVLHLQAIVEYKIARAALAKGIGVRTLGEATIARTSREARAQE